jgi:hypothetical protein
VLSTPQWFFTHGFTNIATGAGDDWMNVYGAKGILQVDAEVGTNLFSVGSWDSGLDRLDGLVDLKNTGGTGALEVYDGASTAGHFYTLDQNLVHRTDKEMILHQGMSSVTLSGGFWHDEFTIKNTGQPTTIYGNYSGYEGGQNDYFSVERTTAPLTIHLIEGPTWIDVGNNQSSLDNIQGKISVFPLANNQMTLRMIDTATTTPRAFSINETAYERTTDESGSAWRTLVDVGVPISTFSYLGSGGGTTVYVKSTAPGTFSTISGSPGKFDNFHVGDAGNADRILGGVVFHGDISWDQAFYYDSTSPAARTYAVTVSPIFPDIMTVSRSDASYVGFSQIAYVELHAPQVGGNQINVQATPAFLFLGLKAGDGDTVTAGSFAPNLGGQLTQIKGGLWADSYDLYDAIDIILDDSGNPDTTPRNPTITVWPPEFGNGATGYIDYLGPEVLAWNIGENSSVSIYGNAADERFVMGLPNTGDNATISLPALSINGGGGVNSLDFSEHDPFPSLNKWYEAEGNAKDSGWSMSDGTLIGGVTFAPGRVGQAFSFDGIDDRVAFGFGVDAWYGITFEAWINTTATNTAMIVGTGGGAATHSGLGLFVANGVAQFSGSNGVLGQTAFLLNGGIVNDGNWHHVAGTWTGDMTTNGVRLYVDGALVGQTTAQLQSAFGDFLGIGGHSVYQYSKFAGKIDEVALYTDPLTAEEIQELFEAGSQGKSGLRKGVTVNLQTGTASGLAGGIASIQSVIGSRGDDILVGTGGNVLTGGAGRDLLIAGLTASQLFGGDDEDILIGGTTVHDTNATNLKAISDIWTSGADYSSRVESLKGELLGQGKVFSNGQQNTLFGQGGMDVFFLSGVDLHDAVEGEELVGI